MSGLTEWVAFKTRMMKELEPVIPNYHMRLAEVSNQWKQRKAALKTGSAPKCSSHTQVDNHKQLTGLGVHELADALGVNIEHNMAPMFSGTTIGGEFSKSQAQKILTEAELEQGRNYASRFAKNSDARGNTSRIIDAQLSLTEQGDRTKYNPTNLASLVDVASGGALPRLAEPPLQSPAGNGYGGAYVGAGVTPAAYMMTHDGKVPEAYKKEHHHYILDTEVLPHIASAIMPHLM